jgi:hypothetical protein
MNGTQDIGFSLFYGYARFRIKKIKKSQLFEHVCKSCILHT